MSKNATNMFCLALAAMCLILIGADRAASEGMARAVGRPEALELIHAAEPETLVSTSTAHVVWMEVTAYCPCSKCCGAGAHGVTASGRDVRYNGGAFVAADTRAYPFGTRLSVPGYHDGQTVEVIDRGGAIKGAHLDVFFPTHEQALQWGRRRLPVTILQ
jgi:3D (Asp-Asp-Asp) domain-containing protein